MILKPGKKHQAMELYKVCTNHDPVMALIYLWEGQRMSPMNLNEKNGKMYFKLVISLLLVSYLVITIYLLAHLSPMLKR